MTWSAACTEVTYSAGTSNKFYRTYLMIDADSGDVQVLFNWGRIGATGQFKAEKFNNHSVAGAAVDKKLSEKAAKGYGGERYWRLPIVPEELLGKCDVQLGTAERKELDTRLEHDDFGRFAAEADKLIRVVTGPDPLGGEAIVLRSTLQEQLDALRTRLMEAEGQMELIIDVMEMKVNA